jgi:hypothetical protein
MLSIELTDEHAAILREYLRRDLSDLSVEIADTDRLEYRESLKVERRLLQEIAAQLGEFDDEQENPRKDAMRK